jgi:hypothetical protein
MIIATVIIIVMMLMVLTVKIVIILIAMLLLLLIMIILAIIVVRLLIPSRLYFWYIDRTFICFEVVWVECSKSELDVPNSSIWKGFSNV